MKKKLTEIDEEIAHQDRLRLQAWRTYITENIKDIGDSLDKNGRAEIPSLNIGEYYPCTNPVELRLVHQAPMPDGSGLISLGLNTQRVIEWVNLPKPPPKYVSIEEFHFG